MPQEVCDFTEGAVRRNRDTGEVVELTDDHQYGDSRHVTGENRSGQQVGQEPQPSQPADQAYSADSNRQSGSRLARKHTTGRQSSQRGCRQERRGRFGAYGQLPRRPKHRVHKQWPHRRPQAGDWRKAGHFRVGHDLRNQIGRDSTARDDIAAEPGPPVMPQNVDPWEKPASSARRACSRIVVLQKQPFCPRPQRREQDRLKPSPAASS